MNKKGKIDGKTILVIAVILALLVGVFIYSAQTKSVLEHKEPADISKNEKGTGLDLKLYDAQGNEIQIPSWFSTASIIEPGQFTIIRHPPAPSCTTRTQCTGYLTNPNIMCWEATCALGNVASLTMGVSVTNPITSQLSFLNLVPTTVLPAEFNTALTKTPYAKLSPGQTTSWTSSIISVAAWTGSKTFSTTINGTNEYTGAINTVTDSLTLDFYVDPTGSLTVAIVSPI